MKQLLALSIAFMALTNTLSGQFLEQEIILDSLVGSNGVIFEDFNDDGISEYIVARFNEDVVTLVYWDGSQFVEEDLISIDQPNDLVTGDFNMDGRLDIAITASNILGIRILRNLGNLDFSTQTINSFDYENAGSIATSDFDQDGDLDLIVSSFISDDIALFELTNPDFFSYDVTIIDNAVDSRDIEIGDFDNDGLPDFASTNRFGNELNIYFNDGNNNFQKTTYPFTDATNICTTDFNNDGFLDIAITSFGDNSVFIFFNNTDRTFQEAFVDLNIQDPNSISCLNIDGDSFEDIVVGTRFGLVYYIAKDISNVDFLRFDIPFDGWVGPFDVEDVDGDDDLDLIASSTALPGLILYRNTTFTSSIEDAELPRINVYPNPSNDIIHIDGDSTYDLKLYTMQGRFISSKTNSNQLDVTLIPNGTYMMEVTDINANKTFTEKVVVEK